MSALPPPPTYAPLTVETVNGAQSAINPVWLQWFLQYAQAANSGSITASDPLITLGFSSPGTTIVPSSGGTGISRVMVYIVSGTITGLAIQRVFQGLPFNIVLPVTATSILLVANDKLLITSSSSGSVGIQPF